jgi:hydrogenase-1 operon protein HyaE
MTTQFELAAAPAGRERLAQALARLTRQYAFQPITDLAAALAAGTHVLLLTADPQGAPETLDAAVILPEALKTGAGEVTRWVAEPEASAEIARQYSIARFPAVLFLRDGAYLGSLVGLRDWQEYRAEVTRLLTAAPQPRPIAIPVVAAPGA